MSSRGLFILSLIIILLCFAKYCYQYYGTNIREENERDNVVYFNDKTVLRKRNNHGGNRNGKQKSTITESPTGTLSPLQHQNSQGFVLPYRLYEQQTSAARNLFELQYWANTVNMKVVEPFVSNISLDLIPIVNGVSNLMTFSDLYDRNYWNEQAIKYGCADLVTWKEFLLNAPKATILVLPWGNKPSSTNKSGYVRTVTNPNEIEGDRECQQAQFPAEALKYFRNLGFYFVREVCITFNPTTPMSIQHFSQYILGTHDPNDVTMIFGHWQGMANSRDNIKGVVPLHNCAAVCNLFPSTKMLDFSETYMTKVNPSGSKYFGVMVRIERYLHGLAKNNNKDTLKFLIECATNLTQLFKNHPKWSRTLAIDLGQYGSKQYRHKYLQNKKRSRPEEILYEAFFTPVYGSSNWTIDDFEDSFKRYLNIDNPVVIAQVQRTIAAKSDCLVLIGSGSFQAVAQGMYKRLHPNEQDQCIIKHC